MANRQISPARKGVYYVGMLLIVAGGLSFGSVFITGALHFGDFSGFERRARNEALRAFSGMGMIIVGGILMGIGSRGAAGSGLVLDPEQARKDVEPWSRMTGGMIKDALDETGLLKTQNEDETDLPFDDQLRRLHKLHEEGILSESEYTEKKRQILSRM